MGTALFRSGPHIETTQELNSKFLRKFGSSRISHVHSGVNQTCTGSFVLLALSAAQTITLPTGEVTVAVATSADNANMRGNVITMRYWDIDGVVHTTSATLDAADSSTPVAFSPAVTDFYRLMMLLNTTKKMDTVYLNLHLSGTVTTHYGIIEADERVSYQMAFMATKNTDTAIFDLKARYSAYNGYATLRVTATWESLTGEYETVSEFVIPGLAEVDISGVCRSLVEATEFKFEVMDSGVGGTIDVTFGILVGEYEDYP